MALIPTQNPAALIGYYLGVFSLIPCLGLALGIPAVVCGIIGLSKANATPAIGGKGHAITALVLGAITTLLWGGAVIVFVVAGASAR